MDEKIREEFNKSWDIDNELEKNEYRKTALRLIKEATEENDLDGIKDILESLEHEIGTL